MFKDTDTEDLQHDIALAMAYNAIDELTEKMIQELKSRKAALPINAKMVFSPYTRLGRSLTYQLEETT